MSGPVPVFTMDSAVLGLGSSGCDCCAVRVFDRNLHSRMPLVPTHVRLKLFHACDQWHSSRKFTPLTSSHCKFRRNTQGFDHPNVVQCFGMSDDGDPAMIVRCLFFCLVRVRVRVSTIGLRLLYGACFSALLGLGLGLAPSGCGCCTVPVFQQKSTPKDAIGIHAFAPPLEALPCV
jgi:hypothetical protein